MSALNKRCKLLYFQVAYKMKDNSDIILPEFESDLARLSKKYGLGFIKVHTIKDEIGEYERYITHYVKGRSLCQR